MRFALPQISEELPAQGMEQEEGLPRAALDWRPEPQKHSWPYSRPARLKLLPAVVQKVWQDSMVMPAVLV